MFKKLKNAKIDSYFLELDHPFSKRRKFKENRVKWLLSLTLGFLVTIVLFTGNTPTKNDESSTPPPESANRSSVPPSKTRKGFYEERLHARATVTSPKNYTASQLVVRSGQNSAVTEHLPMGSTIPVKLANTVLSSDSESPIVAETHDDIFWDNQLVIPQGTKAIGHGTLDDSTERLKCRFHTLVFPDGSQHSISGLALLADGSSGLPGRYHSQRLRKHSGQFLGDFVSGTAQGLKERRADGQVGLTHEPGNIRNGLLNGAAQSALDYANSYSEEMKNIHPYLEVTQGTAFVLYLEREFSP